MLRLPGNKPRRGKGLAEGDAEPRALAGGCRALPETMGLGVSDGNLLSEGWTERVHGAGELTSWGEAEARMRLPVRGRSRRIIRQSKHRFPRSSRGVSDRAQTSGTPKVQQRWPVTPVTHDKVPVGAGCSLALASRVAPWPCWVAGACLRWICSTSSSGISKASELFPSALSSRSPKVL